MRQTISLVMIARDEERFISEALESASAWADELIVLDTGSRDRTVELARAAGAQVHHFEWRDDFAAARNASLSYARSDWVAVLDADERFVTDSPERVHELLQRTKAWPYQALMLRLENYSLEGALRSVTRAPRIFPRHPDLGYEGRIHENLGSLSRGDEQGLSLIRCEGLKLIHYGYDPQLAISRGKSERNMRLLRRAYEQAPEQRRYAFYLAKEHELIGEDELAERAYREALEGGDSAGRPLRISAYAGLLRCLRHRRAAPLERLAQAVEALELSPESADFWLELSRCYSALGQPEEELASLLQSLERIEGDPLYFGSEALVHRAQLRVAAGQRLWDQGHREEALPHLREAIKDSSLSPELFALALERLCYQLLEQGRWPELKALCPALLLAHERGLAVTRELLLALKQCGEGPIAQALSMELTRLQSTL